jgi:hypothetical protein
LSSIPSYLFDLFDLSIQEHLSFLLLQQEGWLCNGIAVLLLVIGHLAHRLAVEEHLCPYLSLLEYRDYVSVMEVEGAARVDECSILQAIVLELLLVLVGDAESLDSFIVSEFQVCFSCAILYQAKHLDGEDRILKEASIATD